MPKVYALIVAGEIMRKVCVLIVAAVIAVATFYLLPAVAQTTFPGPVATACAVTTSSGTCINANPTRRAIEICNVGAGVIWISPGSAAAAANGGTSYLLAPVTTPTVQCYRTPTNVVGGAGAQWNAISVTTNSTLTVYEY